MKTQAEVIEIVKNNNPQEFEKFGRVKYEIAEEDQVLVTEIKGEKETEKSILKGDVIITGPTGARYSPGSLEKFLTRNEIITPGYAKPKGKFYGNIYHGEPITFKANWGEEMICNDGDYLGSPDNQFSEAYRIHIDEFKDTYKPVVDSIDINSHVNNN